MACIFFRAVHFFNESGTVYTSPLIKNRAGDATIWDGKTANIWVMVSQSTPDYSQIAVLLQTMSHVVVKSILQRSGSTSCMTA